MANSLISWSALFSLISVLYEYDTEPSKIVILNFKAKQSKVKLGEGHRLYVHQIFRK